mmetsp:Transcript_154749/g.288486  ORF Transcript_154749/g.288486 Transcript_154749/m.288486 type:complete len:86 (+) Transcript_154749:1738-1995(+)
MPGGSLSSPSFLGDFICDVGKLHQKLMHALAHAYRSMCMKTRSFQCIVLTSWAQTDQKLYKVSSNAQSEYSCLQFLKTFHVRIFV